MMSVMSSTPSPAVSALGWAHIHLSGIFYYFLELLEADDFLRSTILHLKIIFIFIVTWGHTRGVG